MSTSCPDCIKFILTISVCRREHANLVPICPPLISLVWSIQKCNMQSRIDQRTVIKFMVAQDKTPIQCWRDLVAVYGDQSLGKTQVRHWHKLFKRGDLNTSAKDAKKTGRPRSARTDENVDLIRQLVEEDRRKTVCELVAQSGLSQGTVHRILTKELKLSRICAKFVPRLLTAEQKEHRAKLCADNLSSLDDGGKFFMEQIVSGDETWLYCFDPESKQCSSQWHPKGGDQTVGQMCRSCRGVL